MIHAFFNITLLFFILMDAPGNIPIFVGVLKHFDPARQQKIIVREMLIALGFMIIFLIFGQGFFQILNVSQPSLQMAGGIILFLIAIPMIFAYPSQEKEQKNVKDPLIVPLAVPAIAGPAILANIVLYGGREFSKFTVFLAIFLAWLMLFPFLFFSTYLKRWLGENGLAALERLFGYVVVLIAVEMAVEGTIAFFTI